MAQVQKLIHAFFGRWSSGTWWSSTWPSRKQSSSWLWYVTYSVSHPITIVRTTSSFFLLCFPVLPITSSHPSSLCIFTSILSPFFLDGLGIANAYGGVPSTRQSFVLYALAALLGLYFLDNIMFRDYTAGARACLSLRAMDH